MDAVLASRGYLHTSLTLSPAGPTAVFARSIYKLALGSAADAKKFISRTKSSESRDGRIPGA